MTKRKEYPYTLGEKITVTKRLYRREIIRNQSYIKVWVNQDLPAPVEVMVIGYRTINNGIVERSGHGEPFEYTPDQYIDVILVVEDLHTNPYYVTL